ncbi:MAG TPA: sugar transferase [Candidatus Atribacteria bacterium]|nr:sugar transferase [Candidatus Atribacteria bacterium]
MLKRLIDILLSSVALIILSPLFAIVAILIKLDSPGPVFYRGVRIGRYGRPFRIYKFRTMVANAERIGGPSTAADDPRLTKIGRKFIKRFNLDELPQFINVLKGEMSIVGPRPEVPEVINLLPANERNVLLSVRPGITDWATLWIRDEAERLEGSPEPHQKYLKEIWPTKRKLALKYVRSHSLWTDFKIMFKTLKVHLIDRLLSR